MRESSKTLFKNIAIDRTLISNPMLLPLGALGVLSGEYSRAIITELTEPDFYSQR